MSEVRVNRIRPVTGSEVNIDELRTRNAVVLNQNESDARYQLDSSNQPITHNTRAEAIADNNSSRQFIKVGDFGLATYRRASDDSEYSSFPDSGRFTDSSSIRWVLRFFDKMSFFGLSANSDITKEMQFACDNHDNSTPILIDISGDVFLNDAVIPSDGNTIKGLGRDVTVIKRNNNSLRTFFRSVSAPVSDMSGASDVIFRDLGFDSNWPTYTDLLSFITIGRCSNNKVIDCDFTNCVYGHAIDASTFDNLSVTGCNFRGFRQTYIRDGVESTDNRNFAEAIQCSSREEAVSPRYNADRYVYDGVFISNCYFGDSEHTDFTPWPTGAGDHGAFPHGEYNRRMEVSYCTMDNCTFAGVRPFKVVDTNIHNNRFINCNIDVAYPSVSPGTASSENRDGTQSNLPDAGSDHRIYHNESNAGSFFVRVDGFSSASNAAPVKNINIFNNNISGSLNDNQTLELNVAENVHIYKNEFNSSALPIHVDSVRNVTIEDNDLGGASREFILAERNHDFSGVFDSKNLWVINNDMIGNPLNSIFVNGFDSIFIQNNTVEKTSADGFRCIRTENCNNGFIDHNILTSQSTSGQSVIVTSTCSGIVVGSNISNQSINVHQATNTVGALLGSSATAISSLEEVSANADNSVTRKP